MPIQSLDINHFTLWMILAAIEIHVSFLLEIPINADDEIGS
jgi:hypothetical protein